MADTKISELPVATAVASPDVAPIVQGGVTKQANVSLFGGSFISANIARVDPSGNDGTGTVGDLNKPFLTVQAAINAIQAGSFTNPVIDTGTSDYTETLTTSLDQLTFIGTGRPFDALTTTETTNNVVLKFNGLNTGTITASNTFGVSVISIYLENTKTDDITSTGDINIYGDGNNSKVGVAGTISAPGAIIQAYHTYVARINSAGSQVSLDAGTYLSLLSACSSLVLQDSRVETNSSGVTPIYSDIILDPSRMDFSTLPTAQPTEVGKAWIDTTGGFNIVKVKL